MKANCVVCGKEFEKRGNTKTCGTVCGMELIREERRKHVVIVCIWCGKRFERRGPTKTCGKECSHAYGNSLGRTCQCKECLALRQALSECEVCGELFNKSKGHQKTCGRLCAAKKRKAKLQSWRAANPEKNKEYGRKYRHADPDKYSERSRIRYEKDPERCRQICRAWRAANREGVLADKRMRAAAKRLGLPPLLYAAMKLTDRLTPAPETPDAQDSRPDV